MVLTMEDEINGEEEAYSGRDRCEASASRRADGAGRQVSDAIRSIGVMEVIYYRWRNEYGGLKGDQVKRLKELETENNRLRRAVSDLTLDKLILAEAAKGNF
jgi:transposase-like protein